MRILFALALVTSSSLNANAQDAQEGPTDPPSTHAGDEPCTPPESCGDPGPTAVALARALEARLTVWQRRSGPVYVWHCRQARVDCRARLVAFARLIAVAAVEHGVDPFLVAAMALKESGLNPFAEGSAGERGIVQLHPRGIGSRVRFVRNDRYRERCERRPDACQGEVLAAGAEHIADAMARCETVLEALGAYNSGHCIETPYGNRVMEERENLLRLAKAGVSAQTAALVD